MIRCCTSWCTALFLFFQIIIAGGETMDRKYAHAQEEMKMILQGYEEHRPVSEITGERRMYRKAACMYMEWTIASALQAMHRRR